MSNEISQTWGSDVDRTITGALATVTGTAQGEQRVLRRLLTNPGDYIWHLDYGAGLPRYVGRLNRPGEIEGVIRQQLTLEPIVAQTPPPVVQITSILNGIFVDVAWVDAVTGEPATISFTI